jgi:hypothetical protein
MLESRQRKYGVVRITFEELRKRLGLPDNVVLEMIESENNRRIARFYIGSEEIVPKLTFDTMESYEIPAVSLD